MSHQSLLDQLDQFNEQQLRRILVEHLTERKLGLHWEANLIKRDQALNADLVFPRLVDEYSHALPIEGVVPHLIIEGDNFDSLRMLRATHRGQIRVIYIDPPYNTGEKDWVYNDHYVSTNDRYRHSQWLEFLYQRLCLARDLLSSDGVILVSINDENRSRLELMLDEVMPSRKIGSFVWRTRKGSNDAQRGLLSIDHEHVLVYGNANFEFAGSGRDETKYDNSDNDPRGAWGSQMLIKSHTAKERPEAYYPILNPETVVWYLCEPDSVWRFASTSRPLNKKKLQADPIEIIISEKRILWPSNERTIIYKSLEELSKGINDGTAPKEFRIYLQLNELSILAETNVKVARLLKYIEPLEFWVGKTLGYGRPRYKRFRNSLKRETNPLSSWISFASEPDADLEDFDEVISLGTGGTSEGTSLVRKVLENKDFAYPKPLSLIKNLLQQASRPGDLILDFFAGSGTTGQAILELNAEDEGNRRFILCSSTEATTKEPNKNLCRDICAERLRRVMQGYGNKTGLGGSFAYLQLDKYQEADVQFEVTPAHAAQLLSLQINHGSLAGIDSNDTEYKSLGIIPIANDGQLAIVLVPDPNEVALSALLSWPGERLVVYSTRPQTVTQYFTDAGREVVSHSLHDALLRGQAGGRKS
ncbi:site-specific DNA-methyltransferase [Deefgea piscis]|uniref:site-specific DNA-methyltransferase (adenine-specific) n=1 Tax=Deefgea piscis TaxID=2739061 RepID=A0A6M8STY2_9NEIS|nr:site-specific DNA-methyltransferase [Deefgea piscis]QKJ66830.1 site-specific DNA-methyltransferase [Deefgea piscis]